jgi:hypothetical protein
MTDLTRAERTVLEVVAESCGRWDTRALDFEYYGRSQELLEPSLLHVLRDLEARGLVVEVSIPGGTGPGWNVTPAGRSVTDQSTRPADVREGRDKS